MCLHSAVCTFHSSCVCDCYWKCSISTVSMLSWYIPYKLHCANCVAVHLPVCKHFWAKKMRLMISKWAFSFVWIFFSTIRGWECRMRLSIAYCVAKLQILEFVLNCVFCFFRSKYTGRLRSWVSMACFVNSTSVFYLQCVTIMLFSFSFSLIDYISSFVLLLFQHFDTEITNKQKTHFE